jgi:hypothetical protein
MYIGWLHLKEVKVQREGDGLWSHGTPSLWLEVLMYIGWLHLREVKFQREGDGSFEVWNSKPLAGDVVVY